MVLSLGDMLERMSSALATLEDVARQRNDDLFRETLQVGLRRIPTALRRTVPWLVRAREGGDASLARMVDENQSALPDGLALEMDSVQLSWSDVVTRASRAAHALSDMGVRRGDVVALMGKNSPEYLCHLLAISRVGAVASLINHHLEGSPLAHALSASSAKLTLAEQHFQTVLGDAAPDARATFYQGGDFDDRLQRVSTRPFPRVKVDARSDFVYIFTSGTTGLPKPCRVSHARAVLAGAGFGPLLFEFQPGDKLYCVLPLYHSSGLMIGAGSCFVTRTPLALRESFSASAFWPDVQRYHATAVLYIGELCRYLINQPPCAAERDNPLRVAVGNGLRSDVWEPFQQRFAIESVREFYSATEAPGVIFNLTGRVGSVGHVPLRRLGPLKLARYDVDGDQHVRDDAGRCIECGPGEVGELLIRIDEQAGNALREFRGYTDERETQKKILCDVFKAGDRYFRSGDLMRFDEHDYFYFVDRIGDTYRWKGENVSTAEVAEVLGKAPGVRAATVVGIAVPGNEGRAGLAALEVDGELDVTAFWRVAQRLPPYAQPRFLRVLGRLATTGTFKIQKTELIRDGIEPTRVEGPTWLRLDDGYVPLTPELWQDVVQGRVRL
ncbi:MAG: AMP-binding protein [Polyangiaceae bacterium]|nr:AMP-binding protein [Polyangiaceae bacterium]